MKVNNCNWLLTFFLFCSIMKMVINLKIKIRENDINYIQYGEGKDVVLLHGWGQNIEMMKPIGDRLKGKKVTIIDLPGFGLSSEPKEALTIYDYCDIVEEILKELKIKNPILMGHSFGGRISIIYASRNKVEKLVLFGSPCVRLQKELPLKVRVLKRIKRLPGMDKIGEFAKNFIGSRDYKAASPIMRQILVNTVNEDLSTCAKKIKAPTLLIWGDQDTEATLEEGKLLEELLEDGALIVLENATHYAYLEQIGRVISILDNFI